MNTSSPLVRTPLTLLAAIVPFLAGCSAGVDDAGHYDGERIVATLLADDGSVLPSDPLAEPADPGARTRRQQYATAYQAAMLTDTLRGDVIRLTVDCCSAEARTLAVLTAYGLQAAQGLPNTAPVLVDGADLRQAAAVADQLADADMTHVFLITR